MGRPLLLIVASIDGALLAQSHRSSDGARLAQCHRPFGGWVLLRPPRSWFLLLLVDEVVVPPACSARRLDGLSSVPGAPAVSSDYSPSLLE